MNLIRTHQTLKSTVLLSKTYTNFLFSHSLTCLTPFSYFSNPGQRTYLTKNQKALEELHHAIESKKTDKLYKNFYIHIDDLPSSGLKYKRMSLLLTSPNKVNHASLIYYLQSLSSKEEVIRSLRIMKRCIIQHVHFDDSIMNLFISKCIQYDCLDPCIQFLKEEHFPHVELKPYLFAKLIAATTGSYASSISRQLYSLMIQKYRVHPTSRVCNTLLLQLIQCKDYPNIIKYYNQFDPHTIHISQNVFEQILPLIPEDHKADKLIQEGLDRCIKYKQQQIPTK